jgi:hypothetical protein
MHRFEYGSETLGIVLGWAGTRRMAEDMADHEYDHDPSTGTLYIWDRRARTGQPNLWHRAPGGRWRLTGLNRSLSTLDKSWLTAITIGLAIHLSLFMGSPASWHAWAWLQAGIIVVFGVCAVSAWREPRPPQRNFL